MISLSMVPAREKLRSALVILKPETVMTWHRASFRLFWTWKVRRGQLVRPVISGGIRDLIRKRCLESPGWGAPRIHGELLKLGIDIGESSVSKYMVRSRKPPSQTWRTFLENHVQQLVSIDFFTVTTIRFQVLYVFLVLAHDRRRLVHFNVTAQPTAEWTGQQLREAFPLDQLPRYLLRDRDAIFGNAFRGQVRDMGIQEVLSTPRSPWQRAYVERVIGSMRRECLDHVIVFHETSLRRILVSYFDYYRRSRTHLSLKKDSPEPRSIQPPEMGAVVAVSQVGGLHHRYERRLPGTTRVLPCAAPTSAQPFDVCFRTAALARVCQRISFTRLKQVGELLELRSSPLGNDPQQHAQSFR